jgi:hypothetical protein
MSGSRRPGPGSRAVRSTGRGPLAPAPRTRGPAGHCSPVSTESATSAGSTSTCPRNAGLPDTPRSCLSPWTAHERRGDSLQEDWERAVTALHREGWTATVSVPAPVQVFGTLPTGQKYYFRARHTDVSLAIGGDDPADARIGGADSPTEPGPPPPTSLRTRACPCSAGYTNPGWPILTHRDQPQQADGTRAVRGAA